MKISMDKIIVMLFIVSLASLGIEISAGYDGKHSGLILVFLCLMVVARTLSNVPEDKNNFD